MKIGSLPGLCSAPVRHAKPSGFSLVELLIAVAVLGVLAAIAVPSYREFVAGQRIKTASFDIMAVLTLARSEAIKRNADVAVTPAGGNWADGWTVTEPGGTVLNRQSALIGLTIAGPAGGLSYGSTGRLTTAAATFQVSSDASNQVRCISVDLSGRPNAKTGGC